MINISRRLLIILFNLLKYFSVTRFTLGSPYRKVIVTRRVSGNKHPFSQLPADRCSKDWEKQGKESTLTPKALENLVTESSHSFTLQRRDRRYQ